MKAKGIALMILFVILAVFSLKAQDCNCRDEILHVQKFLKTNYPGYPDKVTEQTLPVYKNLVDDLLSKATMDSYILCISLAVL